MAISSTFYPLQFSKSCHCPVLRRFVVPVNKRLERIEKGELIAPVAVSIGAPGLPLLKGGGVGVLERPVPASDPSEFAFPLAEEVEKALPQVVPSITPERARLLFYESRERGVATVIVTIKEHAEFYAQMMLQQGLRSAVEPDSALAD